MQLVTFWKFDCIRPFKKLIAISVSFDTTDLPFGQLPILEVDGEVLFQSFCISKFLGKKFGEFIYLFYHYDIFTFFSF